MADFLYYANGEFVPASQATVAAGDLGLVRGYGVFDVLRTYDRTPFALRAHLERLARSAGAINLPLPSSLEELEQLVYQTLAHNADVEPERDVTIRLIVTGGSSAGFMLPDGPPSLLILVAPVRSVPTQHYSEGAALITVDIPRFLPNVKSINYIPAILGQQRARAAGAVEALYCTADGVISECTTSNFFVVADGRLITPNQDVLAGVTRNITLELAADVTDVVLRPIQRAWMAFAIVLGWVMTRVILVVLFYVGITPIALIARLVGKRFLDLRFEPARASYWIPRPAPDRGKERYKSQF